MIHAIVLAAGASSRMGRPKAGLPAGPGGDTFVWRLCRTLQRAGLSPVTVVTGAAPEAVGAALPAVRRGVRLVHHDGWQSGQLGSLLAGLAAVDGVTSEAVLVALVDSPLVSAATVEALVARWRATRAPIVRPARGERHGHPVIFDRAVFGELRAADPATGAKPVVHRHAGALEDVEVDDPGAFRDFDTPGDLGALA
ncbi:MAG: NTP transferase domain-containing protein [Vicinamibacterales bacterium]